jgi:hypothetical protein
LCVARVHRAIHTGASTAFKLAQRGKGSLSLAREREMTVAYGATIKEMRLAKHRWATWGMKTEIDRQMNWTQMIESGDNEWLPL